MKHTKHRFLGINNLPADYYWQSADGKKHKEKKIQKMENWLAEVTPIIDGGKELIRASSFDVFIYSIWSQPKEKWLYLNIDQKIKIIGLVITTTISITFGILN